MSRPYTEELVSTESEDGILLQGAVIRPAERSGSSSTGVAQQAAVIWVHGLTGTFYGPTAVRIGRHLAERGITLITGNNRGHDFGALLRLRTGETLLGGGAWERFEESPRDVGAWVTFAEQQGFERVVLLGHSLGGLKVVYYQAERQDPRVQALIVASPPIRSWVRDPAARAAVEQMVATGRGRDLIWNDDYPLFVTASAQTHLSRAEHNLGSFVVEGTPAGKRPALSEIRCPLLALYGTQEPEVGGPEQLKAIRQHATGAPRVDAQMIPDADHAYTGQEQAAARLIGDWLHAIL